MESTFIQVAHEIVICETICLRKEVKYLKRNVIMTCE